MKIYDYPYAPNPQKLRIYVAEKGLSIPLQKVDMAAGEHKTAEFLAKNPLGALPVLDLDDGSYLTESLAIIEYLEELYPAPAMIGYTPLERARVRELERIAESTIFNPIVRIFFNTSAFFQNSYQVPEAAKQAKAALPKALLFMDKTIGEKPFVAGEWPTIADCTLYAAFEHAKRAGIPIDNGYKNLKRWYQSFGRRPSAGA